MEKHNIFIFLMSMLAMLQASAQTEKPNFLFIVVDDLNDYVQGFNGHVQTVTPAFTELENLGVTFLNSYCNAPGCAPSRTSMLSGKDIHYTQVYTNGEYLDEFRNNFTAEKNNAEVFTLPEILKDSGGYFTYAINKIFHNDSNNDYDEGGGDDCARSLSWNRMHSFSDEDWIKTIDSMHNYNESFSWGAVPDSLEKYLEDAVAADSAIAFLDAYANGSANTCGRPFFLALGFHYPHSDRYIPEKYFLPFYTDDFFQEPFTYNYNHPAETYPYNGVVLAPQPAVPFADYDALPEEGIARELANTSFFYDNLQIYLDTLSYFPDISDTLTDEERKNILSLSVQGSYALSYIAATEFVDAQMGRVIDALQLHPELLENTIIVVLSDNGYSLGEKKHWTKWTLWDTDLRIPFIIIHPEALPGTVSYNTTSLLDIFPTICNWAQTPLPVFSNGDKYIDGNDITDIVLNPALTIEKPVLATTKRSGGTGSCFEHYSLRNSRFHYIRYRWNNDGSLPNNYCDSTDNTIEEELYDVGEKRETDDNEWNNLAFNPDYNIVKRYLQQWLPGEIKYNQRAYSLRIQEDDEKCFYELTDTLNLHAQLFDTAGTELFSIPEGMHLAWFTNLTPDTVYTMEQSLVLADIPALASGEETQVLLYLVLYDDLTILQGLCLQMIALENDASVQITFDAYAQGLEVFLTNIQYPPLSDNISWNFGDGYIYNGAAPPAHIYADTGTYNISCSALLQVADTCSIQTAQQITVGNTAEVSITIYPNPVSDELLIHFSPNVFDLHLTLADITGRILLEKQYDKQTLQTLPLEVSAFSNGMYLLQLQNETVQVSKIFEVLR